VNTALTLSLRPLTREAAAALELVVSFDSTCTLPLSMEMTSTSVAAIPAYAASCDWKLASKEAEKVGSSNAEISKSEKEMTEKTV
jgi:hypothetical protein